MSSIVGPNSLGTDEFPKIADIDRNQDKSVDGQLPLSHLDPDLRPLEDKNHIPWIVTLDPVRIDKGDVLISLSSLPEDQLLLSSDILKSYSFFAGAFKGYWNRALLDTKEVRASGNYHGVVLTKYCLSTDRSKKEFDIMKSLEPPNDWYFPWEEDELPNERVPTYYQLTAEKPMDVHLHRQFHYETHAGRRLDYMHFHNSIIALEVPYDHPLAYIYRDDYERCSITAHKIIFRLLYGLDVVLKRWNSAEFFRCMLEVISLADFYGLLSDLRGPIKKLILDWPQIWYAVSCWPHIFNYIGRTLRSFDIYADALKHQAGNGFRDEGPLLSYCKNICEEQDANDTEFGLKEAMFLEQRCAELRQMANQIRVEFNKLCLTTGEFEHESQSGKTVWIVEKKAMFMECKGRITDAHRISFIARGVFNEFLARHLSGISTRSEEQCTSLVSQEWLQMALLCKTCNMIKKHADGNDTSCFGRYAAAVLQRTFKLTTQGSYDVAEQELHKELVGLLHAARDAIRGIFRYIEPARYNRKWKPYFTNVNITRENCDYFSDENSQQSVDACKARGEMMVMATKEWLSLVEMFDGRQ